MTEAKKMNTYLKYGLILLGCCVLGGIIGFVSALTTEPIMAIQTTVEQLGKLIRTYLFAELFIIFVIEIIAGEIYIRKMKQFSAKLETAEDEEADRLDYEMEKASAWGVGILNAIAAISLVLLATGYSMEYIRLEAEVGGLSSLLGGCIVFILIYVYSGFWSVRQVKLQQKLDPTKKGDPTSTKFTEQWVESCDEAEKEVIYRSAFKSYLMLSKWIPMMMVVTMISHLLWNTGVMAVVVVGIVWMVLNVSYLKSCVDLRKQKLR